MAKKKSHSKKQNKKAQPVKQIFSMPKLSWMPLLLALSFFYIEFFAWCFLGEGSTWPLRFGALWAVALTALLRLLPHKAARIVYGAAYFACAVYAGFQTGYYNLFSGMMWLSDFRYAAEGADYFSVLFSYPAGWWLGIVAMIGIALVIRKSDRINRVAAILPRQTMIFGFTN